MINYFKLQDLTYTEFFDKIKKIKVAKSVTGIEYKDIEVTNKSISGKRVSNGKLFVISTESLYQAFSELKNFNTTALKPYVNKVQSPAMAILITSGVIKIDETSVCKPQSVSPRTITHTTEMKVKEEKPRHTITDKIIGLIVIIFISGCLWFNSEPDPYVKDGQLTEVFRPYASRVIKQELNDPDSYRPISWTQATWDSHSQRERYAMVHKFSAKNAFGARIQQTVLILADKQGNITDVQFL